MCESRDKDIPLMKPTFFSQSDKNNPKNQPMNEDDKKDEKKA